MTRTRQPQQGFTLIEVMLSATILVIMSSLVWGSFAISSKGKRKAEVISDRYHQIRLGLGRMTREISMAYLSKNDLFGTNNPRTMFMVKKGAEFDDLTFTSLAHERLHENAKEADQAVVRYFVVSDPDRSDQMNLIRRSSKRLGVERPGEEGAAFVMMEDIRKLKFEFFDEQANEWRDKWDTRSADGQPDRLPRKVRITVEIIDTNGEEVSIVTGTRVFLRDPIWFRP